MFCQYKIVHFAFYSACSERSDRNPCIVLHNLVCVIVFLIAYYLHFLLQPFDIVIFIINIHACLNIYVPPCFIIEL